MSSDSRHGTLVTRLNISFEQTHAFAKWQALLHEEIVTQPGFLSLEILSPDKAKDSGWVIIQRFNNPDDLVAWRQSHQHRELLEKVKPLLDSQEVDGIRESELENYQEQAGATEVFITQIQPEQVAAYRAWVGKIHEAETKFPGFQKVFLQPPMNADGSWITFLQFDNQKNLDLWLTSKERAEVLEKGKFLIRSLESHRVTSSFAGWFQNVLLTGIPPVWKQTMLVLLVLFPLVMLEFKFLFPFTAHLNTSLGTFIGNAISVALVSWPMMPIAIYGLKWWLNPIAKNRYRTEALGVLTVAFLYFLEVAFFWHFLDK